MKPTFACNGLNNDSHIRHPIPMIFSGVERLITSTLASELAETHGKLVETENAIQTATTKHNEYLRELGLPLLPSPGADPSKK